MEVMNCGVYIMTNESHRSLYIGMSTDLPRRISAHREGVVTGFTQRYQCKKLVYYEGCADADEAYLRERQLKGWTRFKKVGVINAMNPSWRDLFKQLVDDCV